MCIFCKIINKDIPCHEIYEDDKTLAFLDIKPVNPGHALVIPKTHYANLEEITPEDLQALILTVKKIAGVKTPILEKVDFEIKKYSYFKSPAWFPDGIKIIQELVQIAIERDVFERKNELLDFARKKTTQKVNLYEKVQIPGYEEAILKIKRFMEDEENLSKAAQKIVKSRMDNQKTEAA